MFPADFHVSGRFPWRRPGNPPAPPLRGHPPRGPEGPAPADHGQDPAQVPAHRHALHQSPATRPSPRSPACSARPGAATETTASASPAAAALQVLIYSNTSLPEQEFTPGGTRSAASPATPETPAAGTPGFPSTAPARPPRCSPPCSRPPASMAPRSTRKPAQPTRTASPGRTHDTGFQMASGDRVLTNAPGGGRSGICSAGMRAGVLSRAGHPTGSAAPGSILGPGLR